MASQADQFNLQYSGFIHAARSLAELGRHDEALAAAYEAAETAKRDRDSQNQAWALWYAARNLFELGRHEEALHMAIEAASIAKDVNDINLRLGAAGILLLASTDSVDIDLAFDSYDLHVQCATITESADPALFFGKIARIATSKLAWPRLITLLANGPDVSEKIAYTSNHLNAACRVIGPAFIAGNHDTARKMLRHVVTALAQGIQTAPDPRVAQLWTAVLNASAEEIATELIDAAFLREVANIYAAHPQVSPRATALLAAAAAYHERGRDPAALARIDPDLATMLMAVFPPSDESPKRTRKPRAKKKKQK